MKPCGEYGCSNSPTKGRAFCSAHLKVREARMLAAQEPVDLDEAEAIVRDSDLNAAERVLMWRLFREVGRLRMSNRLEEEK